MPIESALIIGKDGLIGTALSALLRSKGIRVYGTTRREPAASDIFLNLSDRSLADIELPRTDVAIICAAANGFAFCRANQDYAQRVNAEAPRILARKLTARGSRVIYLSSSAVFDFSRPHVDAASPHCPTTGYGRSKAAGEENVLAAGELATIVRLTKVVAPTTPPFGQWLPKLQAGHMVTAFSDLHFCPIPLDRVTDALLAIAEANLAGTFHVSGAADIDYLSAAKHLAARMRVDNSRIACDSAAAHGIPKEEIAAFTSLDTVRYTSLTGVQPLEPFDALDAAYGPSTGDVGPRTPWLMEAK